MFWDAWGQIFKGKTLMRSLMNIALRDFSVEGTVIDLGGGRNPSYRQYLKGASSATFANIDKQHGEGASRDIDFERDPLPYADGSCDQILMLNVLEHIYRHAFFVSEAFRILKEGKTVIGFVPFLINYHADPHDYFRYTDEALERIFSEAGFRRIDIRPIGMGPFAANFNTMASFMPRFCNALAWPFYYAADRLLLAVKPGMARRFPLGYLFVLTK